MNMLVQAVARGLVLGWWAFFPSMACAASGPAWIGAGLVQYREPMYQGSRLDWCLQWGRQYGEPVATVWCRRQGFDQANSWKIAADIGAAAPTRLL